MSLVYVIHNVIMGAHGREGVGENGQVTCFLLDFENTLDLI